VLRSAWTCRTLRATTAATTDVQTQFLFDAKRGTWVRATAATKAGFLPYRVIRTARKTQRHGALLSLRRDAVVNPTTSGSPWPTLSADLDDAGNLLEFEPSWTTTRLRLVDPLSMAKVHQVVAEYVMDQGAGFAEDYWVVRGRHLFGEGQSQVDATFTLPPPGTDNDDRLRHVADDHREAESIQIVVTRDNISWVPGNDAWRTLEFRSLSLAWDSAQRRSGFYGSAMEATDHSRRQQGAVAARPIPL
jgi:hypothetical protein